MRYLITGITGFAGPHLAKLLYENAHTVYGLTRRSNGTESDILDVLDKDAEELLKRDIEEYIAIHPEVLMREYSRYQETFFQDEFAIYQSQ